MTKKKESVKHYLRNAAIMMVFLAIMACCFGTSVRAAGGTWQGDGTMGNPYLIEDVVDLQALERNVNAGNSYAGQFFMLDRSLDLSSICGEGIGSWTPIGTEQCPFAGMLSGDGNEIYGLYVSSVFGGGLFGYVTGTLNDLYVRGLVKGNDYVGGITSVNAGTIQNCCFDGIVQGNKHVGGITGRNDSVIRNSFSQGSVEANGDVGGITGQNNSTIDTCTNEATIKQTGELVSVGGIAGWNNGVIGGSLNRGNVTAEGKYVGGVAGSHLQDSIWNCTNEGNVSGKNECVGGIVGYAKGDASLDHCHNAGKITSSGQQCVGGIAGKFESSSKGTCVMEECTNEGSVSGGRHAGGIVGEVTGVEIKNCYSRGKVEGGNESGGIAGTLSSNASIISSTNVGEIEGKNIVGGIVGYLHYSQGVRDCLNNGSVTGKTEIGGIAGQALYHYDPNSGYGDTTILYCTNKAKVTGTKFTGGIIGQTNANVKYCVNRGEIHGNECAGGIVGNTEDREYCLENDLNEGSVYGVKKVGGIAGNANRIILLKCGNTGTVIGEDENVGGIIGLIDRGEVRDCYNRGIIYGKSDVGGIVGHYEGETEKMTRCYCKAPKNGLSSDIFGVDCSSGKRVGGLYGGRDNDEVEMSDCYWWSPCAKHAFSKYKDGQDLGGNGYTHYHFESRFSSSSNFDNWDFTDVWEIKGDIPQLRELSNAGGTGRPGTNTVTGGSGAVRPVFISSMDDFLKFAEDVNNGNLEAGKRIYLKVDLDLSNVNWTPIGGNGHGFNGIFDGRNHVIKGLRFDKDAEAAGLFGECGKKSGIRNLIVYGEVKNENEYTGGIAGRSSGEITNCQFYGNVSGSNRDGCTVGGIVGLNEGRVRDCLFSGSVSAKATSMNKTAFAGGIAGETKSGSVTTCMAFGTVSNDGYNESGGGGIVGFLRGGGVYGCGHVGNVDEDGGYGGGVVGIAEDRDNDIRMCFQYGEVNYVATRYVSNRVGGVLGKGNGSSLTDCFALTQGGLKILGNLMAQNQGTRCEMLFKEEFRDPDMFANWNMFSFGGVWCMGPDYPLLQRFCNCAQFLPNGGEGKALVIGVLTGEYNVPEVSEKELKVPAIKVKRDGYYFIGWNYAQVGSGTYYFTGDVVPAGSQLYAQWAQPYQGYVPFKPESHVGDTGATYDMLFDNNVNTTWRISGLDNDAKVSVEFATKDYVIPSGYGFVTGSASRFDPSRNPRNWKFEGKKSQDGEWVILDEVYNDKLLSREAKTPASKTIRNEEEYCYFRLTFWGLNENDVFELSEFWLLTATTRLPKVTLVLDVEEEDAYLSQEGENLSSFQLPEALTEVNGYVLRGWNTQADGKGQAFELGDEYQITGDATLYAFRELETYEITFDVTGADPIDPLEYTMESTEELPGLTMEDYVFDGWKVVSDAGNWLEEDELYPAGTVITGKYGNVTLKAQWSEIPKYTVTWKNYDGEVIKTDADVIEGTVPAYEGDDPMREKTDEYFFTFIGWDKTPEAIEGDMEFTAVYEKTKRKYEITWKLDADTVIDVTQVEYGVVPTHADVTKKATDEKTYVFSGWTPNVKAVEGDAEYTAVFSDSMNSYKITWLMDDGSLLDETFVEYGEVPTHADAVKAETEDYTYTFTGWDVTPVAVTGEATYKATFQENKKDSGEEPGEEPGGETPGEDIPVVTNEYGDYLDELRARLRYAIALGGEQSVYWNKGTSLPKDVLKTLEDHPSITLVFEYVYENEKYSVTMPGKNVKTVESVEWYGPVYLFCAYGKAEAEVATSEVSGIYVVKSGDTLSRIARKLHVKQKYLVDLNKIKNPDVIKAGQALKY